MVDDERIRAVAGRPTGVGGPIDRREIRVLLQRPASGVLPTDRHGAASLADVERGGARGLHHVDERPETAGQRIIAATRGNARIRLAYGARDLISPPGAGAPATGDLGPVNGVLLP